MFNPDWKYVETVQKRIRVLKVNFKDRQVDAYDLDAEYPLVLSANEQVDLDKIKRAKIYQATIKAFEAELTPELERQMVETALGSPERLRAVKDMKASGYKPKKFELIALTH
jgi:hypothetical protein